MPVPVASVGTPVAVGVPALPVELLPLGFCADLVRTLKWC